MGVDLVPIFIYGDENHDKRFKQTVWNSYYKYS